MSHMHNKYIHALHIQTHDILVSKLKLFEFLLSSSNQICQQFLLYSTQIRKQKSGQRNWELKQDNLCPFKSWKGSNL